MSPALRFEIQDSCPACGSAGGHWCYASDLLLGSVRHTFEYLRCRKCRTVFLRDRLDENLLELIYPSTYHPYTTPASAQPPAARVPARFPRAVAGMMRRSLQSFSPESMLRKRFAARVQRWLPQSTEDAVVLDFGCGAGQFLDELRRQGFQTIGMDFSQHALEAVRVRGHVTLEITQSGWDSIADGSVHFARMNHVLEHLYRPREVMGRLKAKLRRGGRLHLALPNSAGVSAGLFGRYWHGLDCPRHIALYPPSVVARMLRECGFTVLDVIQEPLTKDYIRSLAYLGITKGWIAKSNPDRYMGLALPRMLATPPMALALLLGRADRFHVVAES